MMEPSPQRIRHTLAGAFAGVLLVGGAGFLLGRGTSERAPEIVVPPPVVAPEPKPEPEPAPSRGVLGRSDLIALAAAAADAMAAGKWSEVQPRLDEADGRRFKLRLPFGCEGPAARTSNARMRWRYDADAKALRLHVEALTWALSDWSLETPPAETGVVEGDLIEGLWIERPWTSSESCPPAGEAAPDSDSAPAAVPDQTLALGQVSFAKGARNGRVYDAVVKMAEEEVDASRGFSFRVSGRIARLPGAGTVRCRQPGGSGQRPVCLVGVVIDEVAIENPATGKTLATWSAAPRHAPER